MTALELDADFEDSLRAAMLDDIERELVGDRDNLVFRAVQQAHDILRSYADQYGYEVESIIDSFAIDDVTRTESGITVRWGWQHEAAVYMELGTSDHTIDGDPVLSFVWEDNDKRAEDPPQWVREEFEREGDGWRVFFSSVDVRGLPESRYVRRSLTYLRRQLQ